MYDHILSPFKITVIFHHITAKHTCSRSDIYEVVNVCTAPLVVLRTVHRMTNVSYMEHKN